MVKEPLFHGLLVDACNIKCLADALCLLKSIRFAQAIGASNFMKSEAAKWPIYIR